MGRAAERWLKAKKKQPAKQIGVDEKTAGRGHDSVTVVCDLERATVEHVGDDRKKESLDGYLATISKKARERVEAIAVDIWGRFLASIREHVPEAEEKIVFDRYHLMTHMVKAVDEVRKEKNRQLKRGGREMRGCWGVGGWLYSRENLPQRHKRRFQSLRQMHLKTGKAWAMKESLGELWRYRFMALAIRHFKAWFFWATHSRLRFMVEKARMFRKYLRQILTYFWHRIINAVSEGLNSKIETLRKMAHGFRNREHFKTAIYFHCGGLNLYPVTHMNVG